MGSIQKKTLIIVAGVLFIAAGAAMFFIFKKTSVDELVAPSVQMMPDIVFKNLNGEDVAASSFRGRQILYHIWSSWCLRCMEQIPYHAALQEEFGDDFLVIEVNRTETLEIIKKYADELDKSHRLMFVADANDVLYKAIGGFSMPESILVDKDGVVRDHVRGTIDANEMKRRIEDAFVL